MHLGRLDRNLRRHGGRKPTDPAIRDLLPHPTAIRDDIEDSRRERPHHPRHRTLATKPQVQVDDCEEAGSVSPGLHTTHSNSCNAHSELPMTAQDWTESSEAQDTKEGVVNHRAFGDPILVRPLWLR